MKDIYILLTKSDTYISRFINFYTKDKYTHVSISFNENLIPMYSSARKYVHFPLPGGLRHEPLDTGFYKKHSKIPCALYKLEVTDEVFCAAKEEAEEMIKSAKKYKFNVIGMFLCGLNVPFPRKNKYFCSEFVSKILIDNNALKLPKIPCLMKPIDYTKLPELDCIYEGKLNELKIKITA